MTQSSKRNLRIAVWHNLPSGGGKRALYDHVKFLVSAGHQVESWCPPTADQSFLPLGDVVSEHVVDLDEVDQRPFLAMREIATDTNESVRALDRHCQTCAREIRAGGFDVLFANSCMYLRATSIGRHLQGMSRVLYLQEPYRWLYEAMPDPPWAANVRRPSWWLRPTSLFNEGRRSALMRLKAIQIREEVRNAAAFDLILCNSLYSRESVLRAYGLDARVCYLGVDAVPEPADTSSPERKNFFLTVGAVTHEKKVDFLLHALSRRKDRSWPLVWVANVVESDVEERLRKLAATLEIELDLRVRVDDHALAELYRTAGLFLYAPRLEPFGLAPLEAAAQGLPTVAVAEGGVREAISHGESGVLVEADPDRFAAAIDAILTTPGSREALGREARLLVEKRWTTQQAGKRLEDALYGAVDAFSRRGSHPEIRPSRGS